MLKKILALAVLSIPFFISGKLHYAYIHPKSLLFQTICIPMVFLIVWELVWGGRLDNWIKKRKAWKKIKKIKI